MGGGTTVRGRPLELTAYLNNDTYVTRAQVLEWEARRMQVVANRMRGNLLGALVGELDSLITRSAADISNIEDERERLADAKMRVGADGMKALVAPDLVISGAAAELAVVLANDRWNVSQTEIFCNRGTAEGFADWFSRKGVSENDLRAMLVACPDHYFLQGTQPSFQEVYETVGGSVACSQFTINYRDPASLPMTNEPDFPIVFNGAARRNNGTVIGGTNHRLRSLNDGFQLRAAIFFPPTLPPTVVPEHRWHLACEFSNWIEAYIKETGD
ncbi:hypothetical protein [Solimonas sp. SE-A11]|uniref:hypothetical protein n=1 Tax=Solimonas sp. SE-A11 TaxID=3054954 RepID=UPI00259C7F5A|nr:hypothetical protein [Solimonas sp. SE-A11]MDM4769801.1 hypothetical protein [Solimonas sp. SE-A11]